MSINANELVSIRQAANYLNVPLTSLWSHISHSHGRYTQIKIGLQTIGIIPSEFVEYLKAREVRKAGKAAVNA